MSGIYKSPNGDNLFGDGKIVYKEIEHWRESRNRAATENLAFMNTTLEILRSEFNAAHDKLNQARQFENWGAVSLYAELCQHLANAIAAEMTKQTTNITP